MRHGQSDGNASGVVQGRLDMHLSELGRAQSAATAQRLLADGIDGLVSSPLVRALDTARVIGEPVGIDPELDDALCGCRIRGRWHAD
ncbi:MAG: histidine phosphatase family protein [Dehalococcoidia bacterium]|nr:histidine phosphatase family protein [Dehalococcoidia bacterium]